MSNRSTFYRESIPITVRLAQAIGITASSYLCGQLASGTYMLAPALMESESSEVARQWRKAYEVNQTTAVSLSVVSALALGGLAYRENTSSKAFTLLVTATVLVPSIIPYTLFVMSPVVDRISARARPKAPASGSVPGEESSHQLLDRWASLNLGRAVLAGLGSACAAWAVLAEDEGSVEAIGFATGANRLG